MAAPKKGAAPKAAPKAAPNAEASAAPTGPTAEAGGTSPGASQPPGDGGDLPEAPAGQDGTQAASQGLAEGQVAVSCVAPLERFYRCGMRFEREPLVLMVSDLSPGVLERLEAEQNLVVVRG